MVSGPSLPQADAGSRSRRRGCTAAGLTFFEVVFEMLDAADVNAVAAYGAFPRDTRRGGSAWSTRGSAGGTTGDSKITSW